MYIAPRGSTSGNVQDQAAGDGTTTVTVLCGSLLKKCQALLDRGVHPSLISDAFQLAADKGVEVGGLCTCSDAGVL